MKRPAFIRHWKDAESPEQVKPPVMNEPFGYVAELAAATGLSHLRVAHLRLPPGVRSHPPIASRDEDVFFFVLEGAPDLWVDGDLYALKEGDGACFPRAHRHRAFHSQQHAERRAHLPDERGDALSLQIRPSGRCSGRRESAKDGQALGRCARAQARPA